MSAGRVIVPLRPGSDGDISHRPTSQIYTRINPPTLYLEKIGTQWMESRKETVPGVTYVLEKLPAGYTLWQRPRTNNPNQFDKYLHGHPGRLTFDSPGRFFPHFKYLMDNGGNSIGCPCTVCNARGGVIPPLHAAHGSRKDNKNGQAGPSMLKIAHPKHKGRSKRVTPGMDTSRVDEEGTPDVYRNLINKLQKETSLDEAITEPMSMDWRAEQEILPETIRELKENPQWLPRKGDIVLYVRELSVGVEICRDRNTGEFKLLDVDSKTWIGYPSWEAGLVGQTPTETTDIDDLVVETTKLKNVSYSGVRVEPIPSPNNTDKSLSKRYRYVPVHYTRPFVFWKDFLGTLPEALLHPTIKNALTFISSFSLMGKYRFRGTWPSAQIYCHGVYIGSEMLAVGDTVRLMPKSDATSQTCTDVLTITSIRLKLTNLDVANSNDYDEGRPYNSSVQILGRAYTSDAGRSSKKWLSIDAPLPPMIRKQDPWRHPLHPATKEMQVPLSRILGRLFESDAMTLWFPSSTPLTPNKLDPPNLSQGLQGLQEARGYSRENDTRITEQFGATWFWGDSRAEALDLRTVNGLEMSKFDTERDTKAWRKQLKATEHAENIAQAQLRQQEDKASASVRGGIPHRSLRAFAAPGTTHATKLPLRNQREGRRGSAGASGTGTPTGTPTTGSFPSSGSGLVASQGRKRNQIIDLDSGDEDDIRQQTRIIEDNVKVKKDAGAERRKKVKVQIVID